VARSIDVRVTPSLPSLNAGAGDPVLIASSLTKRFGDLVAVDELTFALRAGTVTGFLGPNGAGKTTTLRLLLGLARPTAGEALVFGRRYCELDDPTRRVGAVLESNDFHPGRSGRDHLRMLALAAGISRDRVEEVLQLVELEPVARRRRTDSTPPACTGCGASSASSPSKGAPFSSAATSSPRSRRRSTRS
jgi:ABC-2 type transport system ATP-binding protein